MAIAVLASILAACNQEVSNPPASTTPTHVAASTSSAQPSVGPGDSANPSVGPSDSANAECGQVVAATEPKGSSARSLAVFSSRGDLSLYDIAADSVVVLDQGTQSRTGVRPRFRTPGLVSFVRPREPFDEGHTFGQDSLYEYDLESGQATETIRLPNHVLGYDWSPDGTLLAYLLYAETATRVRPVSLCLFDSRRGVTMFLRSLELSVGRGGHQWDEISVAWSATATEILVVDTTAEQPSLRVVDVDGHNVAPPQMGTFARWLADETILFLEGHPQATLGPWHWFSLSTRTGRTRAFGLPDEAFRPALSPAGDVIAFDDGHEEPSIYTFEIETGTIRRLARGYVAPVWLGPDLIAATAAGPCPPGNFCSIPWSVSGTTVGIDPTNGDQRQLALPTTLQEVSRYGVIDVHAAQPTSASR